MTTMGMRRVCFLPADAALTFGAQLALRCWCGRQSRSADIAFLAILRASLPCVSQGAKRLVGALLGHVLAVAAAAVAAVGAIFSALALDARGGRCAASFQMSRHSFGWLH